MKDPEVKEHMTPTKSIRLFALTVVIGLACLGSITWIKQVIDREFFWQGIQGIFVEPGFFLAYGLGLILMGFITSLIFKKYTSSPKEILVISACSACVTGIFFLLGMLFLSVIYEYQLGHYITSTTVLDIIPLAFTHFFRAGLSAFPILPAIVGLEITGSLVFSYCDHIPGNSLQGTKNAVRRPVMVKTVIIVVIAAILMSIILPVVGSIVAISSGTTTCSFCGAWNPVSMKVTRPDNSRINLHMSLDYTGHTRAREISTNSLPLQIMVDDKDFSNQSVIQQQGLTDTISPSEGITGYADGLSVTIRGPEIARNESTGRHIYVISYYDQKNPWVVVDTNV